MWCDEELEDHGEGENNAPFVKVCATMESQPIIFIWACGPSMNKSSDLFMSSWNLGFGDELYDPFISWPLSKKNQIK